MTSGHLEMTEITIPATEFKAKCLKLMDDVKRRRITVVITKRGKPVARIIPPDTKRRSTLFGALKGSVIIKGDIISPLDVEWEALK
jgi:prevent-host-death family protein